MSPSRRKLNRQWLVAVAALLLAYGPVVGFSMQQARSRSQPIAAEVRERARRAIAAVGLILVRSAGDPANQARPRGSAVLVRKDGVVATNHHVIARDRSDQVYDEIYLSLSGSGGLSWPIGASYRLKPVLINKAYDLALLRIASDAESGSARGAAFPAVELGDSRAVQLLDDVVIIGFPEKGGPTVTVNTGVVEGKDSIRQWIKIDGRLIHGNSGGAAVNADGKLIGIPTKVVVDSDSSRAYGSVGYLRPAHLVAAMLAQLDSGTVSKMPSPPPPAPSDLPRSAQTFMVAGVVKSVNGKPVAGARVGLIPTGSASVTAANLLAWGGSNADGNFKLNRPVPAGRYTLRARAIGYEAFSTDIDIRDNTDELVVELKPGK